MLALREERQTSLDRLAFYPSKLFLVWPYEPCRPHRAGGGDPGGPEDSRVHEGAEDEATPGHGPGGAGQQLHPQVEPWLSRKTAGS